MSCSSIKSRKYQAGLTLLELTVVLLILIGLSGLILPYAQGYLQRTHDSTGNDNLWELNNAINLFQAKYLEYPDGFHTLISSITGNPVYSDLMNTALVVPASPSMIEQMSLTMAGINKVWTMKDGAANGSATFDAVSALASVTASSPPNLAVVTHGPDFSSAARHLAFAFYNNSAKYTEFDTNCYSYVAFGVGPESEMVGKVMSDAPLHFAATGGMGPEQKYNRFVAVFKVDKSNSSGCSDHTEPAKLVGSAMLMMPNHLFGLAHTQAHTWENIGDKAN
jgi:type II secretory pathway pseudopilin PulG